MEPLFEEKDVEMEIDVNKKFHFPSEVVVKKYKNNNLIIYTEGVLWLVQRFFDAHILSRLFLTSIFPVKCFGC